MYLELQHPEITWIERTGYPSWMQDDVDDDDGRLNYDPDAEYEREREKGLFPDD